MKKMVEQQLVALKLIKRCNVAVGSLVGPKEEKKIEFISTNSHETEKILARRQAKQRCYLKDSKQKNV